MASGVWLLRCSILVALLTVCEGRRSLWEINAHLGSDVLKSEGPKGDSRVMMAAIRKNTGSERWPGNVIPYQLSSNYNQAQRQTLRTSFDSLEKISCFKFVSRTNEIDYLFIEPLDGCYSFVGRIGGEQKMSLAVDCLVDYIIWHEMLHVVGFEHEHQRPDRDRYIRVLFDNVSPDQIGNFDKIPDRDLERYDHEYDYKSIMHYDSAAFGMWDPIRGRRKQTMVPIRSGIQLIDNMYLTQLDIKKLNDIGNCSVRQRSGLTSCVDKRNDCLRYLRQGFCRSPNFSYLKTMQDYCAKTCNLCHGRL